MSIIEHILLISLLFIVYPFWGKYNANKSGMNFGVAAIIPILMYVIVVGSRYGWGADYLWYKYQFENIFLLVTETDQIVFRWLNQFLSIIGFNYVGAFMVYAFIFITCAFVLLRSYREQSIYMYSFLLPATLRFTSGIIRQGLGISFIYLALVFFYQRKWLLMALVVLIAINIHTATILLLAPMLGIFFIFKKPINLWLSIPLFLFFAFVFDPEKITFLADFLSNTIKLDSGFQSYIDNSDRWFGEVAINDLYLQSTPTLILSSLFYISIFYLGYRALKVRENKQVLYIYNTVVLGSIMLKAVSFFEILRRLAEPMAMFYFIPLGYVFYVYFKDCKQPENKDAVQLKKWFPVGIFFILAWLFIHYRDFLFFNPKADFFWYHLD